MFSSRGETKEFMMMNHLNAYSNYKIEITKSYNGAGRTGLSVIDLQSCQLTYCTDNNHVWPGTLAGLSVTIDCAEGYIGERTRVCGNEKLKPQWLEADESECRSLNPPKTSVYIDFAIAVTEVTVETMTSSGKSAVLTVLNSLFSILLSEMEAWKVKDITDDTMENPVTQTAVWVRITRASEGGIALSSVDEDIVMAITNGLNDIASKLKEVNREIFPESCSLSFYLIPFLSTYHDYSTEVPTEEPTEEPMLLALNDLLFFIFVIVVVLSVLITLFTLMRKSNKRKRSLPKKSIQTVREMEKRIPSKPIRVDPVEVQPTIDKGVYIMDNMIQNQMPVVVTVVDDRP